MPFGNRDDWEATADRLLLAVRPYASPRRALIDLPGSRPSRSGPRSDGLEGYARTFLLAAFRVAGAAGHDPHGHLAHYAEGLAAGTEKPVRDSGLSATAPDSWPLMADVRQAVVEAASVALALRLTRPWLWDTLDERSRDRVVEWLRPALGPSPVDNNWWLFGLTVAGFLQDAGIETDRARATVDRSLARVEEWHLGDGWYSDGPNRAFDHYNAWALHFYPVLHAHLAGDRELLGRYGPRLRAQLEAATRMFDANGAPMPYGRSLTYRFAAAAAPWLGALTGHTPLTPGATRRLASGTLRYFLDRGAVDDRGLLTLGWHGPYAPVVQSYSGPASPYWAAKGFLGLLLPPDHPAWTDPEEPLPAEIRDAVTTLGPPNMLIQSTAADGLVRLHNHGSNHAGPGEDPGYARFAYSTRTGPTHEGADDAHDGADDAHEGAAPDESAGAADHHHTADNHFALLVDGVWTRRGPAIPLSGGPGWVASAHTPAPGIRVVSATAAHGRAELRVHLVTGAPEGTPVRQTGWATDDRAAGPLEPAGDRVTAQLHPVHGYTTTTELRTGSTSLAARTRTAALDGRTTAGGTLFVALASLTAEPEPAPVSTLADVRVTGRTVRVTWTDGSTTCLSPDY
ncbi:hypothetical protein AR457_14445 [Streptomyces agglomeratus]|uniref:DUF2264 domain-containing protein n=1 Tax=Streptomyces agglomeratus TaxID=285458 RepID=A0A1E5P7H3_9ACTN|nr:DUF2264 domain-containing protein [Streptomyces agglomeratus]OEJ25480.1 hypothetical protein AS594_14260 [Streptomyces agglomeratus]OEJ40481.1 hypothetical protein BGK70_22210 [Streptomyces agglomeratus]OEJ45139.1 hypothetical protein AR457_14445 [Streptomyces agglomeratus]OEJ53032.1 hypothetical protein BGK72_21850 [Streptomyces agglomeratus]OEJ60368.1 hypothetical protein BGM19_22550 [Streptomyces agglomeratus]